MSDDSTNRMISMYMDEASAPMFLSGMFRSPPENFHDTERVELDVIREDPDIAVVVQDLTAGARDNEATRYTNKSFVPPIFKEKGAITSYHQIKRQPGENPFANPDYGANALGEAFRVFRKLERKIRRSVELMAAQVLQTGVLTLSDAGGNTLYTLDFKPKSANHATVSTDWAVDGSSGDPLTDLEAQVRVIRQNGKKSPKRMVFGTSAWQRFRANSDVQAMFRTDAFKGSMGELAPDARGEGASFMGYVILGSYRMEMWLYEAEYKNPNGGALTPYVAADKVIIVGDGRLDLTYGGIPRLLPPDPQAMPFLPTRMSDSERGLDLTTNAWITENRENLIVQAGTRPLTIPTAIDTIGSLDVVQ